MRTKKTLALLKMRKLSFFVSCVSIGMPVAQKDVKEMKVLTVTLKIVRTVDHTGQIFIKPVCSLG